MPSRQRIVVPRYIEQHLRCERCGNRFTSEVRKGIAPRWCSDLCRKRDYLDRDGHRERANLFKRIDYHVERAYKRITLKNPVVH